MKYLWMTLTLTLASQAVAQRSITMFAGPLYSPTASTTPTAQNPRVNTALQTLAERFKQQTGITVNFVNPAINSSDGQGTDPAKWQAYMQSNVAAGTAPDIVIVQQGPDQSGSGWFFPITDLLKQPNSFVRGNRQWRDLFYPKALEREQGVGGQDFTVPFAANYPYVLIGTFYNKDLLKKAGITATPRNWEQWLGELTRLKAAGINAIAPFPVEAKSGSVWPMWSTLVPAFTAHLVPRVDADKDGAISPREIATAVKNGVITMNDEHFREAFRQYKRQLALYLPGWNSADVQAAWNTGQVAQKYGGYWEIYGERSNTAREFDWGFLPILPVTTATSRLVTWKPKLAPTGAARLNGIDGSSVKYAIVKSSVEKNKNLDAAVQWLKFITAPDANEFVVNENPNYIPAVRGAKPDPLWNQLANVAVPDFGATLYPFGLDQEQQTTLQRNVTSWAFGRLTDAQFFNATQQDMVRAANKVLGSTP